MYCLTFAYVLHDLFCNPTGSMTSLLGLPWDQCSKSRAPPNLDQGSKHTRAPLHTGNHVNAMHNATMLHHHISTIQSENLRLLICTVAR